MSESPASTTDLTSQYTAQLAGDLERNLKEQERVSAEIAALQQQLAVLQHDRTVLVNMQQALGVAAPDNASERAAPAGSAESAVTSRADAVPGRAKVPAPRGRGGVKSAADKPKRGKKTASAAPRAARKKQAPAPSGGRSEAPKLVDLVRQHLAEQNEPRSAAEITTALGQSHPERSIKTTVVRSTLEGLVARNQAQRTKQGSSVFYTSAGTTEQTGKSGKNEKSEKPAPDDRS